MNDIQQRILMIFKVVAKLCDDHQIPYYAIGGTCIGAVRHKGFIPWDDDLDIAIPIEHFDRFAELAKTQLPEPYYFYNYKDIPHCPYVWSKVCDRTTTFIEDHEVNYKDVYKGVFVDIMPMSGVPMDLKERQRFFKKVKSFRSHNHVRRFPVHASNGLKLMVRRLEKLPTMIHPFYYYAERYMDLMRRYPVCESQAVGYTWAPISLPRLVFPVEWFSQAVDLDFEDTKIHCPKNYHEYLTQHFGDYMTLPPEEKRAVHNGFVDLNKSYLEYRTTGLPQISGN